MKKYLLILVLLAGSVLAQDPTYTVHNYALPSVATADLIGIPRQQMVCLPTADHIICRWGVTHRLYKSEDGGVTFDADYKTMSSYTARHMHLFMWGDTLYIFDGWDSSVGEDSAQIFIVDPEADSTASGMGLIFHDTVSFLPYGNANSGVIWSGGPTGATANEMVAVIRDGYTCNAWTVSTDRGRTWSVPVDSGFADCTSGRIGLFPVGDSVAVVLHDAWDGVFHYNTTANTWSEETSDSTHIVTTGYRRAFCAVELNDTVYVGYIKDGDTAYYVNSVEINGSNTLTLTQMWNGTAVYISSPEYHPYIAMTTIKSINAIGAFYTHFVTGQSTPQYARVYFRLRYNGVWQDEQLVCDSSYCSNISAPYIVPTAHGAKAYCMVSRRYDGVDRGVSQLVVVDINIPSKSYKAAHLRKVKI